MQKNILFVFYICIYLHDDVMYLHIYWRLTFIFFFQLRARDRVGRASVKTLWFPRSAEFSRYCVLCVVCWVTKHNAAKIFYIITHFSVGVEPTTCRGYTFYSCATTGLNDVKYRYFVKKTILIKKNVDVVSF